VGVVGPGDVESVVDEGDHDALEIHAGRKGGDAVVDLDADVHSVDGRPQSSSADATRDARWTVSFGISGSSWARRMISANRASIRRASRWTNSSSVLQSIGG
jgi:hypothetical protein